jgi:ubiquinone/menaquinone biosynthesis C-methylase UbiE
LPLVNTVDAQSLYSYEPFTRHGFYREMNQALVSRAFDCLPVPPPQRGMAVVDLGCGTGALTALLVEEFRQREVPAMINGIDPSQSALAVAARQFPKEASVRLLRGDVSVIARLAPVDTVFFGNAIHLVADKDDLLERIGRALVPGGLLAMNSSFFTGAYAPGTERFYRLWIARALRRLRQTHPQVRLSRNTGTPAMDWLSAEEYGLLLRRQGFEVLTCAMDEAHMSLQSFQDIGHYSLFIEGALPGAPLDAGADALGFGAAEAFGELDLDFLPRRWLQLVARRC